MNEIVQASFSRKRVFGSKKTLLQSLGEGLQRRRGLIQAIQWIVVIFYLGLLIWPAFLPLPVTYVHFYDNLVLFAQFVFWGLWWPFVMLSMMLIGRVWCGVFCPEGMLTELASRHGLGRAIPGWMRWGGWPFIAFSVTTVYGQLVSVYEYPKAALLVLGGSTVMAIVVGFIYGRGVRVWCMYLCPANGVFSLLSRLAPLHFRVDADAWVKAPRRTPAVDCAPLINIQAMSGNSACHMCGRCSGHRNAVMLAARSPNREILSIRDEDGSRWEALLLVFGLLGIATGAFQWSASPWFITMKQYLAGWLIDHHLFAPLQDNAPWWLLTHYPETNDVFTWLDGICILIYIGATALVFGIWILFMLRLAGRILGKGAMPWRLAYGLTPLAGISIFLGLFSLTAGMLKAERLEIGWLPGLRAVLLVLGLLWSAWLMRRMITAYNSIPAWRQWAAWLVLMAGACITVASWVLVFYIW